MPSFQDSAVIFVIALLLFGPKKLPELARQLGKLMGEFRRASNDFRIQMEDELRMSEQADRQKEIAAMEAAAPKAELAAETYPAEEVHPHLRAEVAAEPEAEVLPIATSGDLQMMPPASGLPVARGASEQAVEAVTEESGETLRPLLDSLPESEYGDVHASAGADHHG